MIFKYFKKLFSTKQIKFQMAIEDNNINVVKKLIKDKEIDISYLNNKAIHSSSKNGYIDIVKLLLESDKDVFKHTCNPLYEATISNHITIIKILLKDTRIGNVNLESSLIIAARLNYIEITSLLLKDERVDPSYSSNCAIRYAHYYENPEIVKLLWSNKKFKNTLKNDEISIELLTKTKPHIYNELLILDIKNKIERFYL
jgi:ankyrin repeat protein